MMRRFASDYWCLRSGPSRSNVCVCVCVFSGTELSTVFYCTFVINCILQWYFTDEVEDPKQTEHIQSNLSGSNSLGTMKICSRYGLFEPLRVNHSVRSGSK